MASWGREGVADFEDTWRREDKRESDHQRQRGCCIESRQSENCSRQLNNSNSSRGIQDENERENGPLFTRRRMKFVHNEGRARLQFLERLQAETAPSFVQDMATYALEDELKVEGQLGEGGFGTVSKVMHRRTGVRYALKKINDNHSKTQYKAAVIEISALTMVRGCDNVVAMVAADDGKPGAPILMELCVGTMADIVYGTNPRKHSTADVLRFLAEGASGLAWCHDRAIVHADVKSNNLLIRRQPHGRDGGWHDMAVIADFGYAMSVGQSRDNGRGTPGYTPPEVFGRCKGRGVTACGSQDVFAVGAMAGGALIKDHLRCCNIFTNPILFTPEEQHMRTVVENTGDGNLLNEFETKVMSRTMVDMSVIEKFLVPENMRTDLPALRSICGGIASMIHPEVTNRPSASEVAFLFKCWSLRAGAGDQDVPAHLALHMTTAAGEEATSPSTVASDSAVARAATRIATRWRCFKERHFLRRDPKWVEYDAAFTRDNNSSAAAALPAVTTATKASSAALGTVIAATAPPPSPPPPPPPTAVIHVTDLEAEFFALAVNQDQAELNAADGAGTRATRAAEAALKRILRIGIPSRERGTNSNVQSTPPGADEVVLRPAPVAGITRTGAAAVEAAEINLKRLLGIAPYCRTNPTPPASRGCPVPPSGPAADASGDQGWNDDEWGHFVFINSPCEEKRGPEEVSLPPPSASPAAGRGLVDERLLSPLPSPSHCKGVKQQQDSRRAEVCLKTALGKPPATSQPVTNIMSRSTITADLTPPKSGGESYKPKDTARAPVHARVPWFQTVAPATRREIPGSQPVAYGPGRSNAMLYRDPNAGIEREGGGFDDFGLGRSEWGEGGGGSGVSRFYPFGMFGADLRIWGTGWGVEGPFHVERW